MKGILRTFLRILLWIFAAAALFGGPYLVCVLLDLPRSAAIAASTLICALLLGIVLARRLLLRRKRLLQIQKIVTVDATGIGDDAPASRLIDNRWSRAVAVMRESYLGRRGTPLYALPWYMIMGKTGAGKSSSVEHCGLNAMQTDVGPEEDGTSTRNCDWHFFRQAVVMDTAGRYAVPVNEAEDSAEWRRFLAKLARYRRKEPLNGLVIAVAADTLHGNGEHLLPEARCLRRRIDEVMRILGAKFPVYLLVTKIDLPAGMARLLENLPEAVKQQSMGILIQSPEKKKLLPVATQINNALRALAERLRTFCLYAGNPGVEDSPSPHRILAWEELRAMLPALRVYAEELFAANPYQEPPLLRGIFLSSALRGPQEDSRAFPALSVPARRALRIRETTVGGIFLHDFFSRVLPADRSLHRPIAEYLRWRSSLRAIAYGAMLLATFGVSLLFCLSYRHNANLMHSLAYLENVSPDAGMARRLLDFEQLFRSEARLEQDLASRLPAMGFDHAKTAFQAHAKALNQSFYRSVLNPALAALDERRSHLTAETDDKEFFILISDLVWRYDLLNAVSNGADFEELLRIPAMPQGILRSLGLADTPRLAPSVAYSMARSMYSIHDEAEREQQLYTMRDALSRLPRIKSHSLQWIVHRAGTLSTLTPVHGDSFWPDSPGGRLHNVKLDPVYTKEGMAVTLEYLDNLNLILDDHALEPSTKEFLRWYASSYSHAWRNFALDFTKQTTALATLPAKDEIISLMSTERNPYFTLLSRMDDELQAIRPYLDPAPGWMDDLAVFTHALRLLAQSSEQEKPSIAQRLKNGAEDFYRGLRDEVDAASREQDMKARLLAKEVKSYLDSLHGLVPFTLSNSLAFNAVKDAIPHENNPNAPHAPLTLALTAGNAMNARLARNLAPTSPVSMLTAGPMNFFMRRLMNSASCQIQALWEGEVLARAGRLAPSQLQQGLFAEQGGIARQFADNTLASFLHFTINGYESGTLAGQSIPFTTDFLAFLNSGLAEYKPVREEYGVTISALPADVNEGAAEMPYAVELALDCAREKQELVNYNSPSSAHFSWRRNACGDASLSIHFKTVDLDVLYAGENGFINFLNDFRYGSKTFAAADFPDQKAMLDRLGVSDITLSYRISGAEDLLNGHRFAPETLPFVAAQCER